MKFIVTAFFAICICVIQVTITKIYRKIHPKYTFDYLLKYQFSLNTMFCGFLFFVIAFIVFIFMLTSLVIISEKIGYLANLSFIPICLLLNFIIIFSGIVVRLIYNIIRFSVNWILCKKKFTAISENSRTWAFIMASLCYISMSIMKNQSYPFQLIGSNALSIILGRIFWIDYKKNSIKKFFSSFFLLNYQLVFIYSIIISITITSPAVNYLGIKFATIGSSIGNLSAILLIIYIYRKEFCNYLISLIEE